MSHRMKPLPVPSTPAEIALLLHEAVVVGHLAGALVVSRRRPFVPCGVDPADINRECARRYAVYVRYLARESGDQTVNHFEWQVREVDAADVTPFVDRAAQLAAADERANAAQRANVKPTSAADGSQTKET